MALAVVTTQGNCNSADPTGTSVVGTTVTINPRLTVTEGDGGTWKNITFSMTGTSGVAPTIVIPQGSATPWDRSVDTGWWSTDQLTWTAFGTPSFSGGNVHITCPTFAADPIYFARYPRQGPTQISAWITSLNATYPGMLFDLTGGSGFVVSTYSTQTDELSRTVTAQPLYGFSIGNSSTKQIMCHTGGVHASEDFASSCYRAGIEYLLGGSTIANALLARFKVVCLPLMNAPGRWGGHVRAQFQTTNGTYNDLNRHYSDSTFLFETVTHTRSVLLTELPSPRTQVLIDWHTSGQLIAANCGVYSGVGDTLDTQYKSAMNARLAGAGISNPMADLGAYPVGGTSYWGANTAGIPLAQTIEFDDVGLPPATTMGPLMMQAIYDMMQAGNFGANPTAPTGSPFARRRA